MSDTTQLPQPGRFGETRNHLRKVIGVLKGQLSGVRASLKAEQRGRQSDAKAHAEARELDAYTVNLLGTYLVPATLKQDLHLYLRNVVLERTREAHASAMIDLVEEGKPTVWLVVSVAPDLSAKMEISSIDSRSTFSGGPIMQFRFRHLVTGEETFTGLNNGLVDGTEKHIQHFLEKVREVRDAPVRKAAATTARRKTREEKAAEMIEHVRSYLATRCPGLTAVDSADERMQQILPSRKDGLDVASGYFVLTDDLPVIITARCEYCAPDVLYVRLQIGSERQDINVHHIMQEGALRAIEEMLTRQGVVN